MIKEYTQDPKKVEMFEERRKKREKFKEKKSIRRMLYIIGILIPLLSVLYLYYNRDGLKLVTTEDFAFSVLVVVLMEFLLVGTPIIIYCKFSYGLGGFPPFYRQRETLVLYDDRIKNSYSFVGNDGKEMYVVNEIKYSDIKRLVHDVEFKNLNVYCKVDQSIYDGGGTTLYSKKTLDRECIDFYLYYDNNEDFMGKVESRSGVFIRRFNRNRGMRH